MKKTMLVSGLAITLAAACGALAGEKKEKPLAPAKDKIASAQKGKVAPAPSEVLTTGSHLKQKVRRSGLVTDGACQVLVIDQTAIERSGASDLKQLLGRYGANRY